MNSFECSVCRDADPLGFIQSGQQFLVACDLLIIDYMCTFDKMIPAVAIGRIRKYCFVH